jgi:hypothetical protein
MVYSPQNCDAYRQVSAHLMHHRRFQPDLQATTTQNGMEREAGSLCILGRT